MPLYFAYGSNMDEGQMRERCPRAEFQSVAELEGHRLCFPRYSEKRSGGVSSIEKSDGQVVWGVVFKIPEEEMTLLDKSEGYLEGRPANENAYQREESPVKSINNQDLPCFVYIANRDKPYEPSREHYLSYIIRGAKQHRVQGMPEEYIEKLNQIQASD